MSYYTTKVAVPESFITRGKQRLKQYTDTVYLKNGDEFEIELYNPTTNKLLAKIELNGNSIGSGIVLRPGERVFLERYLDDSKKFLFETYKVSGNDNQVEQAIKKNGLVKISFYNEEIPRNILFYPNSGGSTITYTTPINNFYTNTISTNSFNSATSINTTVMNTSLSNDTLRKSRTIETGRVEKGSKSNQTFNYDYSNFSSYSSYSTTWKILPKSEKVLVKEDLTVYCVECGSKRKKDTHKFCPNCGTKY